MLNKLFSFIIVMVVATAAANADVHCRNDGVGGTKCTGYNQNGEYVSTRSRTNSLGIKTTQGRIGNRSVNTRSRVNENASVQNTAARTAVRRNRNIRRASPNAFK